MKHLSPSEFVDFLDGSLPVARAAHVRDCAACQDRADSVRAALDAAGSAGMPEPSPLFWDHLSARVRTEIDETPAPRGRVWLRPVPLLSWSLAAVLVAVLVVRQAPRHVQQQAPWPTGTLADVRAEAADDPAWDLLVSTAGDLQIEDTHAAGLGVRAATIDSAVLELTPAEREELGRLLQDELKHPGA